MSDKVNVTLIGSDSAPRAGSGPQCSCDKRARHASRHVERWDLMTQDERTAASARVAAKECERAGVPLLASEQQHRTVAAALAVTAIAE